MMSALATDSFDLRTLYFQAPQVVFLQAESVRPAPPDPLIDRGANRLVHIGTLGLVVALVLLIGAFSSRLESALIFALLITAAIVALFLL